MKISASEKQLAFLTACILFIFFLTLLILSEGYYGGGDNISHFKFARAAFHRPEFFLDHWAKPVFTLLTAPFAQFGLIGVQVFNLITGVLSAWICYLVSKELKLSYSPVSMIILFFIPVYSIIVISGMTEVLFGFVSILCVYLFLKEKYVLASVILSFLPMVRTEGIVIIPIFALVLLIKRKYYYLPLLLAGFVLYSIIGYFYYKDIFWLITRMPYRGAVDIYGKGSFMYYFHAAHLIFGNVVNFLVILGILHIIISLVTRKEKSLNTLLLVVTPFVIYFMAHVVMWWSGVGNSIGEHRYMVAIAPFAAILCLGGINFLIRLIPPFKYKKYVDLLMIVIFLFFIIPLPFKLHNLPVKLRGTQKVVKECSDWIKENGLDSRKIYLYEPDFFYFLNLDAFNETECHEFVHDVDNPGYKIEKGAIVIWDAHFSPICKLPLEKMQQSKDFRQLKDFSPEAPFKIFNRDYHVVVFEKIEPPFKKSTFAIPM
ncbi:MAG: hypothetical protein JW723_02950 [Bacteroidales bacterium]|nr:hypothetical protein [Bacteroidales bacterium]